LQPLGYLAAIGNQRILGAWNCTDAVVELKSNQRKETVAVSFRGAIKVSSFVATSRLIPPMLPEGD
jgi:hypothetical protein